MMDNYGNQLDNKTEQWFGATVSASGAEGGPIVVSSFSKASPCGVLTSLTDDRFSNWLCRITEAICPYLLQMTAVFLPQTEHSIFRKRTE